MFNMSHRRLGITPDPEVIFNFTTDIITKLLIKSNLFIFYDNFYNPVL